jgi:hypothetical protein
MNSKLERMWKEALVAFRVLSQHFPGGGKPQKDLSIALAKIQTEYLWNKARSITM